MKNKQTSEAALRRRQLERLAAWLKEWKIATRLAATALAAAPEATPEALTYDILGAGRRASRLRVGAKPLVEGDIVLMPPDAEATRERPLYVALIRSERPGAWLAVPFGRFTQAALPGEWATGRRAPALRVLCLWNRGLLEEVRLRRGWRVGRLTAHEGSAVDQLMSLRPGWVPPARLASHIGPPLVHPLDPRHDYIEEERLLWLPQRSQMRLAESRPAYEPEGYDTLPMAAEQKKGWDRNGDGA